MKRALHCLRRTRFLTVVFAATLAACTGPAPDRLDQFELSDEPLIGKFIWHDLITDDPAAARRFYGGLFGWSFEATTHPNGGDYTLIRSGDGYVGGIVEVADREQADFSRWLGYLSVADVDRAVSLTAERGGRAAAGPIDLGNFGRAAAIIDPQGAVVGLLRSRYGDPVDGAPGGAGTIAWNELLAPDADAAAAFYGALAGLQTVEEPRAGGVYRLLRAQGRDRAGVMPLPAKEGEPLWLTHFRVTDVEAAAALAAELGGAVLLAPDTNVRDGRFAVVADPTGAILALQQPAPSTEASP